MNTKHSISESNKWVYLVPFLLAIALSACGGGDSATVTSTDNTVTDPVTDTGGNAGGDTGGDSGTTAANTVDVLCDYSNDTFNESESVNAFSTVIWNCTDSAREMTSNGIPDHQVGTFPNQANPNTISGQSINASFTLTPELAATSTTLGGPRGAQGYILNGVKVDAGTGGSCSDYGNACSLADNSGGWSIEALGQSHFDFGTDENNAHVQPTGEYHYHGLPEGFITLRGGDDTKMTLIGWASDGFPIYARYGYSDPNDASSQIVAMQGSYQHVTTVSDTRPPVETYQMGTFAQDWQYVEGSGDLDECNGRFGVTPEFPEGIFHYYATDTYPYFQRCVSGDI